LLIRSFICSGNKHIQTVQIQQNMLCAFNIFVPIPMQEMVYFKGYTKKRPNERLCVGNHRSKNVSEEI